MKKIVFTIEQLYGGGAERVTAALANQMCASHEIHVVAYKRDGKEYDTDSRITWHEMNAVAGGRIRGILSRIKFLKQTISEIDADCVISLATPKMTTLLTIALMGSKVPLILSERNDPVRFPCSRLLRVCRFLTYAKCDGVVFQTQEARDYFPEFIKRKSTVIKNPIIGNLPARWDGPRDQKIVNCCRLNTQKNLGLLIDAFAAIAQKYPEYSLYIYGEGPERSNLEQKIKNMNMAQRIFLPGYSSNIHQDILKAAMFVSSSDYEGISNSMLEAIALGVPTVCTDCPAGGARETISHGMNGLLVPVQDCVALSDAMDNLLSDKDLADRISINGVALREELDTSVVADRWCEFVTCITGAK